MRIISFSKRWDKLQQPEFTTFRFPRKDRDWEEGEVIKKELRKIATAYEEYRPTETEAKADGFENLFEMNTYFRKSYGEERIFREPINKLTLRWVVPPLGQEKK